MTKLALALQLEDCRRRTLNALSISFLVALLFCFSLSKAFAGTTYYVSTSGDDANTGNSLSAPLRNINTAMKKAVAGDTVLVRGGTYREQVEIVSGGGSSGNYVTLANYGGETPILKGSDVVTGWTQHSGNIWKKTGWGNNSQQVFVDFDSNPGKPLQQIGMPSSFFTTFEYNAQVGTGLSSMTAGTFFYDGSTLYVWLADGSSPNSHVMEVSTRPRLLYMGVPYIYLKGLTFRHTNATATSQQGSAVEMSSNSVVDSCDVQWTDFSGIGMGYLANNTVAINNNASNNGSTGISTAGTTAFRVSGNKMNFNNYRTFNRLWHAGGFKGTAKSYGTVEANETAFNNGSGIWCDNCNSGGQVVIRNNFSHDNGPKEAGIFVEESSNALIYNNVVVNNARRGIYLSASNNSQILNNTIVGTSDYAALEVNGMPRPNATLMNNSVYNNIISGSSTLYDLNIAAPNGSDVSNNKSNYNIIYRGGQPLNLAATQLVSTLGAWQSMTGNDTNSISADPMFIGTGSATNYGVRDGSPAIDKGVAVGIVLNDYSAGSRPVGAGYDIGAFEKGSTGGTTTAPAPTPSPTPTPTPTPSPTPATTPTGTTTTTSPSSSTLPVVTMNAPDSGSITGSVTVTATATSSKGINQMNVYFDGAKMGSSANGQVSATFPLSGYRIGSHELRVSAQDTSGNVGAAVKTFQVTDGTAPAPTTTTPTPTPTPTTTSTGPDSTPPIVRITGPGDGASVTGSVTISATATDNVGVTQMSILVDGTVKATSTSGSISYSWSTYGLRSGTHAIRVSAGDAAQNTGAGNISVVVY